MSAKITPGHNARAIRSTTSLGGVDVAKNAQVTVIEHGDDTAWFTARLEASHLILPVGDFEPVEPPEPFATSTPLDPSKVKAGDTVTLFVAPAGHAPTFTVAGETYLNGDIVMVGGWPVMDPRTTLTDHQLAPEPEPEWEPEMVAVATVRGVEGVRIVRTDNPHFPWASGATVKANWLHATSSVTDVRPLVVIDPAAVDWRGLQSQMSVLVVGAEPFKRAGDILAVVRRELGIEATS